MKNIGVLLFVFVFAHGICLAGDKGLLAQWDFEDCANGKVLNFATGERDAEIKNCEVVKTPFGSVLKMGEKSSFRSSNPKIKLESFSVSFWIYPSNLKDDQSGVWAPGGGPGFGTFHFTLRKDGSVYAGIFAFSRFTPTLLKAGTMKCGEWQFIVFTFDNTDAKLYRNGQLIAQMTMRMPDEWNGFGGHGAFLGDIRIYSKALTAEDILQDWEKNKGRVSLREKDFCPVKKQVTQNFIFNGSFEEHSLADVPDSWSVQYWWPMTNFLDGFKVHCDSNEAAVGKSSLCFDSTHHKENFTTSLMRLRCIRNGFPREKMPAKAVLSFYGKASEDNIPIYLDASTYKPEIYRFTLGREWQRFSVRLDRVSDSGPVFEIFPCPLVPGSSKTGREFRKEYSGGSVAHNYYPGNLKIWIDGLQLEDGDTMTDFVERKDSAPSSQQKIKMPKPEVTANITDQRLTLDEAMSDAVSAKFTPIDKFYRLGSGDFDDKTKVRQFMDSDNLYIIAECSELKGIDFRKNKAKNKGMEVFNDDVLEIFLMPDRETKHYYHFAVNSDNVKYSSAAEYQSTLLRYVNNNDWNSPLKSQTKKLNGKWIAGVAIPLNWLNSLRNGSAIGINFCRNGASWSPLEKSFHEPDRFGLLKGMGAESTRIAETPKLDSFSLDYDPVSGGRVLGVVVSSPSETEIHTVFSCSLKLTEEPGAKAVTAKNNVTLKKGVQTIKIPLPEELYDLHKIEISIKDVASGKFIADKKDFIRIENPLSTKIDRLIFKGEKISGIIFCPSHDSGLKAFIKLLDPDGKTACSSSSPTSGRFELAVDTAKLAEGLYALETSLEYKGEHRFSETKNVYISEKALSWSRIDFENDNLVFNGTASYPVFPYHHPEDSLGELKKMGCNFTFYTPGNGWRNFNRKELYIAGESLKYLDSAQKADIGVFIDFNEIIRRAQLNPNSYTENDVHDAIKSILNEVKRHPAYAGAHIFDEPCWARTSAFASQEGLKKIRDIIEKEDPRHVIFFVNGGFMRYRASFELTDIIFYDHYVGSPINGKPRDIQGNYNSSVVEALKIAEFYHKPMWRCLESDDGFQFIPPSRDEWQTLVYSTLICGAKGINLFGGVPAFHSQRENYMAELKNAVDRLTPYLFSGNKSSNVKCIRDCDDIIWREYTLNGKTIIVAVNISGGKNFVKLAASTLSLKLAFKTKDDCELEKDSEAFKLTMPGFSSVIINIE